MGDAEKLEKLNEKADELIDLCKDYIEEDFEDCNS
jgi:hypothetical protein